MFLCKMAGIYLTIFIVLLSFLQCLGSDDYYELLGVKKNADAREIRRAFKQLAVMMHPDKNVDDPESHNKFVKIAEAYEVLKDPNKRQEYDIHGKTGFKSAPPRYHSYTYYRDQFGIYDDDPLIATLSGDDFESSVSDGIWFVNFYSPNCHHCHELAPEWRELSKRLEGVIRVAAVNCDDDGDLCWNLMIRQYPTLMFFTEKATMHTGREYAGDRTAKTMDKFVMSHLSQTLNIPVIKNEKELRSKNTPWLLFICSDDHDCDGQTEYVKLASLLKNLVSVARVLDKKFIKTLIGDDSVGDVIFWEDGKRIDVINWTDYMDVANIIIDKLPESRMLSAEEFEDAKTRLKYGAEEPWLICFTIGRDTSHLIMLKRLSGLLNSINVAQVNCGRYSTLCGSMHIARYPMWAVLKRGGAMEYYNGRSTLHGVQRFALDTSSAANLHALTPNDINDIMGKGHPWMIGWLMTGCPPCKKMLPALRKASTHFEPDILQFGTIDCAIHSQTCRKYNVNRYPTAIIYNGSSTLTFQGNSDEKSIIEFIQSMQINNVIKLNRDTFYAEVGGKPESELWIVEFFASWCAPCQALQPQWRKLALKLSHLNDVHVGAVDCVEQAELCQEQGVQAYPTIRLYPFDGRGVNTVSVFPRDREKNLQNIHKWMLSFMPSIVTKLSDQNFKTMLEDKSEARAWLVMFHAPWCGFCHQFEPDFITAAQILSDSIVGASVDCQRYGNVCSKQHITSYPSVKLYQKSKRGNLAGVSLHGRNYEDLVAEVKSVAPEVIVTPVDHDEL